MARSSCSKSFIHGPDDLRLWQSNRGRGTMAIKHFTVSDQVSRHRPLNSTSVLRRSREVKTVQRAMYCRRGNEQILAHGLCATCYALKRQDEEYLGGLRERVLERDGYCCRVCGASRRPKRSIVVHHRVSGRWLLHLMISLCPGCFAKISWTKAVLGRCHLFCWNCGAKQHPEGHEQTSLGCVTKGTVPRAVPLFDFQT